MRVPALVLVPGALLHEAGRIAHALIRGGERFRVCAVVDPDCDEGDAGSLLDGKHRGMPVVASIDEAIDESRQTPEYCIIGMATDDGRLDDALRALVRDALKNGLPVVNPLAQRLAEDEEIAALARAAKVELIDLCAAPAQLPTADPANRASSRRLAVLGTGAAVGKHTTARQLLKALRHAERRAELIYTGQTGWLQGGRFGLVMDALQDTQVLPALTAVVEQCDRETRAELVLIESHSSRHAIDDGELARAAGAAAAILQHSPNAGKARPVADKLAELRAAGVQVLAVSLRARQAADAERAAREIAAQCNLPTFTDSAPQAAALAQLVLNWLDGGDSPANEDQSTAASTDLAD